MNFGRSGAIAGAVAAFGFTALHQVVISNIWFSLPIMVIAGAACGLCIGWTYGILKPSHVLRAWIGYNLAYVGMFAVMAAVSVVLFEPITTMAALIEANESPNELIAEAGPMTIGFTLVFALLITLTFPQRRAAIGPVLITCAVLVITLGLNVSIIGLVDIPTSDVGVIAELFALILVMDIAFVVAFLALERGLWGSAALD
jgi:hypothetical protein